MAIEEGYEILVNDTDDMVLICTELCKAGFHFTCFEWNGRWRILLTGAF